MSSQSHSAAAAASVSTKPVHPVVLTTFAPTGCELSTWAYLTEPRPDPRISSTTTEPILPNLVVAHGNCLRIYAVDTHTGTLLLASTYDRLAGNIISLHTLPSAAGHGLSEGAAATAATAVVYDGLLLGFAGHPQISIVYPPHISSSNSSWTGVLSASSIVDLTPALTELSMGSVSALDCDIICAVSDPKSYLPPILDIPSSLGMKSKESMNNYSTKYSRASHLLHMNTTVAVILGGGVGIALFQLLPKHRSISSGNSPSSSATMSTGWWKVATEPYILPLPLLYQQLINRASSSNHPLSTQTSSATATTTASMGFTLTAASKSSKTMITASYGFGDILAINFLKGLVEPTIVILHSNPNNGRGGVAWSGRMAHGSSSCRTPLTLTAISVSITQQRSVVLWTLKDMIPVDAWDIQSHPIQGCLVICVNEVLYVDNCGRLKAALAVNGWVRATASSVLLSKIQPTRTPLDTKMDNKDKDSSSLTFLYQRATKASSPSFMQPNPSPLPKLAIQLDGSRMVFVGDNLAIVALRDGTLFLLEIHHRKNTLLGSRRSSDKQHLCIISMAPTGRKLGSLGMISTLSYVPLLRLSGEEKRMSNVKAYESIQRILLSSTKKEENEYDVLNILLSKMQGTSQLNPFSMGLIFAGSRVGDSSLLVYGVKENVAFLPCTDEGHESNNNTDLSSPGGKRKHITDTEQPMSRAKNDAYDANKDITMNISDDDKSLTEDEKMRREEEMLYAPPSAMTSINHETQRCQTVSDDDESEPSDNTLLGVRNNYVSRQQIKSMCMLDSMQILDSLTGLGPIGPGCKGPLACSLQNPSDLFKTRLPGTQLTVVGSSTQIHPCGYNTSGGLAILHCPGMNHSSTILSEIDCKGIDSLFSSAGHIFLTLDTGGCLVLRETLQEDSSTSYYNAESVIAPRGFEWTEVDISDWTEEHTYILSGTEIKSTINIQTLFTKGRVYMISEHHFTPFFDKPSSVALAYFEGKYIIAVLSVSSSSGDAMKIDFHQILGSSSMVDRGTLNSLSNIQNIDGGCVDTFAVACVWENNILSVVTVSYDADNWNVHEAILPPYIEDFAVRFDDIDNEDETAQFYTTHKIVASDLFVASEDLFPYHEATPDSCMEAKNRDPNIPVIHSLNHDKFISQDDMNLYEDDDAIGIIPSCESPVALFSQNDIAPCRYNTLAGYVSGANLSRRGRVYVAIYYQSGKVDIIDFSRFIRYGHGNGAYDIPRSDIIAACVWSAQSSSLGISCLSSENASHFTAPKFHKAHVSEAKLFFVGPSCCESNDRDLSLLRSLCLLIETNVGDLYMYTAKRSKNGKLEFIRVPLGFIARTSKEEVRHGTKLRRRKILKDVNTNNDSFRKARLHRFFSISGQDGLFAATARPAWFVSERGAPYVLCHRLRYAAPAGGRILPVAGFSPNFKIRSNEYRNNCFITLHERIGRVGSQRLTIYSNLSDVFGSYGLLPGGNVAIEKIPLGVTVRKIVFIDDVSISSVTHPVYALLISRELDKDQSHLHDDGLHAIDRRLVKQEREKEKIRRQVEADLGGFDVEQEWVEDIERDDVFEVETRYGRAPTIPFRVYEIWVR